MNKLEILKEITEKMKYANERLKSYLEKNTDNYSVEESMELVKNIGYWQGQFEALSNINL